MSDTPAAETVDTNLALPLARIKRIAKSSKDVRLISTDSAYMISKATELFIEMLAVEAYKNTAKNKRKIIKYEDVAAAIAEREELSFAAEVVPEKAPTPGKGGKQSTL
eukprot:TRINITY_DN685_c0_g1_i1.p1 TRINITY_DN685_c0_g1~~TRINITY_DN685_c0_g1_i1.p1  ORF type:complete len:117 (-),score=74.50 TRINITY_DN685_c0_g1_i1:171-494(-)